MIRIGKNREGKKELRGKGKFPASAIGFNLFSEPFEFQTASTNRALREEGRREGKRATDNLA